MVPDKLVKDSEWLLKSFARGWIGVPGLVEGMMFGLTDCESTEEACRAFIAPFPSEARDELFRA
ncbi:MAG: hypothetical protein WAM08_09430, partial [Candidatus Acidiferrales bacterium]